MKNGSFAGAVPEEIKQWLICSRVGIGDREYQQGRAHVYDQWLEFISIEAAAKGT